MIIPPNFSTPHQNKERRNNVKTQKQKQSCKGRGFSYKLFHMVSQQLYEDIWVTFPTKLAILTKWKQQLNKIMLLNMPTTTISCNMIMFLLFVLFCYTILKQQA